MKYILRIVNINMELLNEIGYVLFCFLLLVFLFVVVISVLLEMVLFFLFLV